MNMVSSDGVNPVKEKSVDVSEGNLGREGLIAEDDQGRL